MTARRILVAVFATLTCVGTSFATELRPLTPVAAMEFAAAAQWSSWLASGTSSGQWRLRAVQRDPDLPARRHQRYAQTIKPCAGLRS